jgi:ribosomal protein S18 acetylase RimI-like enzyme
MPVVPEPAETTPLTDPPPSPPSTPPSTADELALERVAAHGLRPAETEDLSGWLLRADSGFTHRANSVLPLHRPRMPLDEALDRATAWYAARGLPVQLQVPLEARRLLDAELAELGWPADLLTRMLAADVDALRADTARLSTVTIADAPDDDWLTLYRGGAGLAARARALLTRHDTLGFATARVDGRAVAVARGAVDEGWLGVMAVEVDADYRRQGFAGAVMAALWAWGRGRGAVRSYVQVEAANDAAVALYEKQGYRFHHDYHYRSAPAS